MTAKGPRMVHGEYSPAARLAQHLKDVQIMQDLATSRASSLPLSDTHARLLQSAIDMGWGDQDNSALFEVLRRRES